MLALSVQGIYSASQSILTLDTLRTEENSLYRLSSSGSCNVLFLKMESLVIFQYTFLSTHPCLCSPWWSIKWNHIFLVNIVSLHVVLLNKNSRQEVLWVLRAPQMLFGTPASPVESSLSLVSWTELCYSASGSWKMLVSNVEEGWSWGQSEESLPETKESHTLLTFLAKGMKWVHFSRVHGKSTWYMGSTAEVLI